MSRIRPMSIVLIIVGVVIIGVGVSLLVSNSQSSDNETAAEHQTAVAPAEQMIPEPSSQTVDEEDSHVKGQAFEQYVVSKFSKKYWTIHEWRGDKKSGDRYAETSTYPDLEMTLNVKGKEYTIAVECKWRRTAAADSSVKWSYPDQLERYRKFQKDKDMPVFIALGIGGEPSSPDHLYLISLNNIQSPTILLEHYSAFSHDMKKNIFYDTESGELR